jgi:hypothetical protein
LYLLAGVVALLGVPQAMGEPLCKPDLVVKDVKFSEMHLWQRVWTARIAVDASRCASASGRFSIDFVRLKEIGPDLRFTEQFTWRPGQVDVSTDFAADEAVLNYSIGDVAPCRCRE